MKTRRSRRTAPGTIATLFGAVRAVIEDGYVSLAKSVMGRAEQLEDMRAGQGYAKRVRKAERQRLRQAQKNDAASRRVAARPLSVP